jgi:hypothetical protein
MTGSAARSDPSHENPRAKPYSLITNSAGMPFGVSSRWGHHQDASLNPAGRTSEPSAEPISLGRVYVSNQSLACNSIDAVDYFAVKGEQVGRLLFRLILG